MTMTSSRVTLEAAGTELHIDIRGMHFEVPITDGVAQRRDVIDLGYDAALSMQELGSVYRAISALGVQLDSPGYDARF